jgi:hypothetical protein
MVIFPWTDAEARSLLSEENATWVIKLERSDSVGSGISVSISQRWIRPLPSPHANDLLSGEKVMSLTE